MGGNVSIASKAVRMASDITPQVERIFARNANSFGDVTGILVNVAKKGRPAQFVMTDPGGIATLRVVFKDPALERQMLSATGKGGVETALRGWMNKATKNQYGSHVFTATMERPPTPTLYSDLLAQQGSYAYHPGEVGHRGEVLMDMVPGGRTVSVDNGKFVIGVNGVLPHDGSDIIDMTDLWGSGVR